MKDSIFTQIIKGEIPSHKIYEDENTLAFLNIYPVQPGHVLVIPKKQVEFVWDLEDADYQSLMVTVRNVAQHLKAVLSSPYIGESIVGTEVPHAHVHLIPFSEASQLRVIPDTSVDPDHAALAALAQKLALPVH